MQLNGRWSGTVFCFESENAKDCLLLCHTLTVLLLHSHLSGVQTAAKSFSLACGEASLPGPARSALRGGIAIAERHTLPHWVVEGQS